MPSRARRARPFGRHAALSSQGRVTGHSGIGCVSAKANPGPTSGSSLSRIGRVVGKFVVGQAVSLSVIGGLGSYFSTGSAGRCAAAGVAGATGVAVCGVLGER